MQSRETDVAGKIALAHYFLKPVLITLWRHHDFNELEDCELVVALFEVRQSVENSYDS